MFSLFLILLLFKPNIAYKTMPVFIIDYKNVMDDLVLKPNPFVTMSNAHFSNILHDCIKRSDVIIIFVEDTYCVEDVAIKDELGSPYENLRADLHDDTAKYIPKVADAFTVIRQIFNPEIYNTFYLNSRTEIHDLFREQFNYYFIFKYFYVFFDDEPNETRAESLRRHDSIMKEVSQVVRQMTAGAVIAIYTGVGNPMSLGVKTGSEKLTQNPIFDFTMPVPLSVTPEPQKREKIEVMVDTDVVLFRFVGVTMSSKTRRSTFNVVPKEVTETWNQGTLATKMAYGEFELEFDFGIGDDGWLLDKVILFEDGKEVGRRLMGVGAPWNRSYYCGEPLTVVNKKDGRTVAIKEYQIQPFQPQLYKKQKRALEEGSMEVLTSPMSLLRYRRDDNTTSDENGNKTTDDEAKSSDDENETDDKTGKCFGDAVNCGPYFNTHILTGLMLSTICLSPIAFGLYFLYNCNTHDKYDEVHRHTFVSAPEWCSCCKLPWECCKCAPEWCRCAREGCVCEREGCQCADEGCEFHKLLKLTQKVPKRAGDVPKRAEDVPKRPGQKPKCALQIVKRSDEATKQTKDLIEQLKEVSKQTKLVPERAAVVPRTEGVPKRAEGAPKQAEEAYNRTDEPLKQAGEASKRTDEAPKRAEEVAAKSCDTCDKGLFKQCKGVHAEKVPNEAEDVSKQTKEEPKQTDKVANRAEDELKQTKEVAKRAEDELKQTKEAAKRAEYELKQTKEVAKRAENELKQTKELAKRAEDELKQTKELAKRAEDELKQTKELAKRAEDELKQTKEVAKRAEDELKQTKEVAKRAEEEFIETDEVSNRAEEEPNQTEEVPNKAEKVSRSPGGCDTKGHKR